MLRKYCEPVGVHKHYKGWQRTSSRSPASAEQMDNEENDRKDQQKMNERGGNVEHKKCPNPREEQNKREAKK